VKNFFHGGFFDILHIFHISSEIHCTFSEEQIHPRLSAHIRVPLFFQKCHLTNEDALSFNFSDYNGFGSLELEPELALRVLK